uniref:Vitellogenin 3, phosvitinless n=1 Tax=Gasterosteus aculeatus aculeatus TaxID=481459 RepID=A0AAQ4P1C5_GASAC
MQGLLLFCLVALAEPGLSPKKTYKYKYVGDVNFGLGKPNLAESATRISCNIKIAGASQQTFILQVSDFAFEDFNGVKGRNRFTAVPKLTERIASQLVKPFMFDYVGGHVSNIRTSAKTSDTIVNLVRGILGLFHVTVKTTQRIYELEESSIHGVCPSHYATEVNEETKDMAVIQVVDISNCREKAAIYKGMATAVLDDVGKQRGESIVSTVRCVYTVKPTADGGLITRAHGHEQQNFSPFNVKGGNFKMEAVNEMVLLSVNDTVGAVEPGPMESKGNLVFMFTDAEINLPIVMQNLEDPITKAAELIKHLAEANRYHIDSTTSEDTIKLYQLLRAMPYEGLDILWKQFAGNEEQRRWFLDMIVEINDARILKFLQARFQARDVTASEAWQTLLLAFNHLQTDANLVEMAKMFLDMPFCKSDVELWHTVVLSYGSLVYKHCAYATPCPAATVQPLLDMAVESLRIRNHDDMVLALKALGNAGHPSSLKTIMRFLPGVAATPVDLPPRVLSAAVQSMRLIAARDPLSVTIQNTLFLQKNNPTEIRMLAFMILFDTKPSMAVVSIVTVHLQEEKNLHVISFAYSYLKSVSRSSTPNNHFLSTACNVAVKILGPRYSRLSYHYSKAIHMDWFNDDFLIGTATEVFMLRSATNIFPTEILMKGEFYFIGRILQLMELGIRADGLKELFANGIPGFKGDLGFSDFQAVLNVLKNWEVLPNDKPVLSAYSRASGQEWFFADLKKETIQNIVKFFRQSASKGSFLWAAIENLQKGVSWHRTKPFLIVEVRYFQATILGLPLEISKYYETINGISVNATASINPPLTERLGQLFTSDISLETDGFIGYTKDFWLYYGINTELFQCGSEFKAKTPIAIPWKFSAKINIAKKKFELNFPPCKKEFNLLSLSSNVYAVSRNIEEPDLDKRTPMIPDSNDEVFQKGNWTQKDKMCVESNIYGAGVCVEYDLRREFYHDEYPLYYFLGYTHVAVKVLPAQAINAVDKIHFEINAGPSSHPASAQELLESLSQVFRNEVNAGHTRINWTAFYLTQQMGNSTFEAVFNVNAFAVSGAKKPEGYNAVFYYTTEEVKKTQLVVSHVKENSNWKICIDTSVKALVGANIKWGAECQSYEMSITSETAHLPGTLPTIKAKIHWSRMPEKVTQACSRLESYIPGMALLLNFYQKQEKNAGQEISASVIASSADSIDVRIQLPEVLKDRMFFCFNSQFGNKTFFVNSSCYSLNIPFDCQNACD